MKPHAARSPLTTMTLWRIQRSGIYELFTNRHDDAIRRLKRATELDPNSSFARGYLGVALLRRRTRRCNRRAGGRKAVKPARSQIVLWETASAWAHLNAERFDEAMNCAKREIEVNPNFPITWHLAAAAAHLGRMTDAKAGLDGYVRLLPGLTLGDPRLTRPFRRPQDRERFLSGLRKAGLPD